ncbi:hypothetical protein [Allosalinactinospora lopnorensis]|uniref:hypothetical protein n=1 Tax=Allosalinactinospora lopnorensis TaxID=1352348 RepID=UPI000623EB1D|nr:hypothetical protein [Allosalinactinospora lopnorensis]
MTDLAELACEDCPADLAVSRGQSPLTGAAVLVVVVKHAATCPWAARCIPTDGSVISAPNGVVIHRVS